MSGMFCCSPNVFCASKGVPFDVFAVVIEFYLVHASVHVEHFCKIYIFSQIAFNLCHSE